MGTNFNYRINICDKCNRYDQIHIGKRSAGWVFHFRAYDENSFPVRRYPIITSYKDWLDFFNDEPGKIFDEYEKEWTIDQFKKTVKEFSTGKKAALYDSTFEDEEGYVFDKIEFC